MGKLTDRLSEIARNAGDLSPLREPVRKVLWDGNRDAILAGKTPAGARVKDLAPSTLKRRKGNGPPRAPRREQSRPIADYTVSVDAGPGRLSFTGSWPDFPEIEYVDAARPTLGFRPEDLQQVRGMLRDQVMKKG